MDEIRIVVAQGDHAVSRDPAVVLSTVLGSCVAACLIDTDARVGGMNHFLLPAPRSAASDDVERRSYGAFAMEVLINALLREGARRERLRAHLYGGANMNPLLRDIGAGNIAFARRFLTDEGIPLVREDLGGPSARRIDFRPVAGLVRARTVSIAPAERAGVQHPASVGDVELF